MQNSALLDSVELYCNFYEQVKLPIVKRDYQSPDIELLTFVCFFRPDTQKRACDYLTTQTTRYQAKSRTLADSLLKAAISNIIM